jgi:hypothetical protein
MSAKKDLKVVSIPIATMLIGYGHHFSLSFRLVLEKYRQPRRNRVLGSEFWGQALYFNVLELALLFNFSFDPNIKIQGLPSIPSYIP